MVINIKWPVYTFVTFLGIQSLFVCSRIRSRCEPWGLTVFAECPLQAPFVLSKSILGAKTGIQSLYQIETIGTMALRFVSQITILAD